MKVKLKDSAPWPLVVLSDGFEVKRLQWSEDDGTHNLNPVRKFIEFQEFIQEDPLEEIVEETVENYESMTKAQLVVLAQEKGIDTSGLTKSKLIEALNGLN